MVEQVKVGLFPHLYHNHFDLSIFRSFCLFVFLIFSFLLGLVIDNGLDVLIKPRCIVEAD